MDENLHDIEDLFRSNLDDYEDIPSQKAWEVIDKQLDKYNVVSIKRKYTNLKKIAGLLLLLFLCSILYEINFIYKNNSLAKNNSIGSNNLNKFNTTTDKASSKKKANDSTTVIDANNTGDRNTENLVLRSAGDEKLITIQQLEPNNTQQFQKQNSNKIKKPGKESKKDLSSRTADQKKKFTTMPTYKLKIKNGNPAEEVQGFSENNNERIGTQPSFFKNPKRTSVEEVKFQSKDSIDSKKLVQSIPTFKKNSTDTGSHTFVKAANKNIGNPSRFSLTPFFSPDIPWYRLQDDKIDNPQEDANEIEKGERHEFSFTMGLIVSYKIDKHWGLVSGVTFSNTNISIEPKTIYAQPDISGSIKYRINTSSGFGYVLPSFSNNPVTGDSLFAFTSSHSLQYIGIPFATTYSIIKGKFTVNAMAGISANILTRAKLETTVEKGFHNSLEKVNNLQGLKKLYFSGLIGVGVDYKLSQGTSLTFEPVTRFAINSINRNAPVKSYPMSVGFAAGVKIDL